MVVAGLGFMGTAPFIADYLVLAIGLIGLVLALAQRNPILRTPPVLMIGVAFILMLLTLPFVYHGDADLVAVLAIAPLLLVPGIAALLERDSQWLAPHAFAIVCLVGAVAACAAGAVEYGASHGARVGVGNNPIHYAGITVVLGYMALTGICQGRSIARLVFLIGPLAGLLAALMSGSRGPLLAWAAMTVVGGPIVIWWFRRDRAFLVTAIAIALVTGAAVVALNQDGRAVASLANIGQAIASSPAEGIAAVVGQDSPTAGSDDARAMMNSAALDALLSSPIVGHGYGQIMGLARAQFPEAGALATLENLHSDIGNFAAMAGGLGLVAYLLVIISPLMLLRLAHLSRQSAMAAALLTIGYLTLGLTNTMFGILPQTVLFSLLLGYFIALAERPAQPLATD